MYSFILSRILTSLLVLLAVTIGIFSLVHLAPGDPIDIMMSGAAANVNADQLREQLGLNDPLPVQYLRYMTNLLQGDLGRSIIGRRPVALEFWTRFPNSALLAVSSMLVAAVVGIAMGVAAGTRPGSKLDYVTMSGAILGISFPSFYLGIVLILVFALRLGWVPVAGTGSFKHLILPTITLAAPTTAVIARLTRSSMMNVLSEPYIRTASAKGLPWPRVVAKHALKNSLIPVVTIIGLQLGYLFGGAVITETVFAWPGLGAYLVDSILRRDFPVVQGFVLLVSIGFILINLVTDVLYALLDPRIAPN